MYACIHGRFVPHDADVVLIGYGDVCLHREGHAYNNGFGRDLELIVRQLLARTPPVAVVFWNMFVWTPNGYRDARYHREAHVAGRGSMGSCGMHAHTCMDVRLDACTAGGLAELHGVVRHDACMHA